MASQDLTIEPLCPPKDNISCTLTSQSNLFLGPVPTYVSLVSSSLSCIGAIAIIATYILFKDLRIGSRSIITNLSIADLFMSLSCIVGGVNYLVNYRRDDSNMCVIFDTICSVQSYITTWSQLSSYVWNCALAVYLFLTIAFAKNRLANRLIPIFHIIAWGLPIFVALPLLCLNYLGYSPYTSNWCFIRDYNYEHNKWLNTNTMLAFLGGRIIPEFISYLLIIILYSIIKCHICNLKRKLTRLRETSLLEHALQKIDNKLLLIPVVFILLRMWGFIQFFFLLAVSHLSETRGCVSLPIHIIHFILSILESIGEGGQGWANAILFIILNEKTRFLMCWNISNFYNKLTKSNTRQMLYDALNSDDTIDDDDTVYSSASTGLHEIGGESFHANVINKT